MYGLYQLGVCSLYEGADWQFVMCAGKIILEAAILTAVVVVSLTAYTLLSLPTKGVALSPGEQKLQRKHQMLLSLPINIYRTTCTIRLTLKQQMLP
jgi:hypothetical protein